MQSTPESYHEIISVVNDYLAQYLKSCQDGQGRISRQIDAVELADKMKLKYWIEEGGLHKDNIHQILEPYLEHSQRMQHPHYIGHQVSVNHLASGIADFIHGSINNPMAIYEMGPSAAVIEKTMVNWMLRKIGWLKSDDITDFSEVEGNGTGVFTHGGSMANLTALLAARAEIDPHAWEDGVASDIVVIAPEVSHYSVARSVSILGIGKRNIWAVKVDEEERMIPNELALCIERARSENKRIMAVIANACATSTGLYDPIREIGEICKKYKVWFHVDGAHGASALLSDKEKHFLEGVELCDSLIWDTHKMLRTSTLSAAVLFKNPRHMIQAFQQKGSYLFHEKENLGFDLLPYTIECTKSSLATKLFWVLAAEGEKGLQEFVEGRYSITRKFYHLISSQDDFECPYFPEANIICFRYSKIDMVNKSQLMIRNQLTIHGNFYITSTEIKNIRYLRMTVINPLTNEEHIKNLLQEIRTIAVKMYH